MDEVQQLRIEPEGDGNPELSIKNDVEEIRKKVNEIKKQLNTHCFDDHVKLETRFTSLESDFDYISKKIEDQISLKSNIDTLQNNINKLESEVKFLKEDFVLIKDLIHQIKNISEGQTSKFGKLEDQYNKLETFNLEKLKSEKDSVKTAWRWRVGMAVTMLLAMLGLQYDSMKDLRLDQKEMVKELKEDTKQNILRVEKNMNDKLIIIERYLNKSIDEKHKRN